MLKNMTMGRKLFFNGLVFFVPLAVLFWFFIAGINSNITFSSLELSGNRLQAPLQALFHDLARRDLLIAGGSSALKDLDQAIDTGIGQYLELESAWGTALRLGDYQGKGGKGIADEWKTLQARGAESPDSLYQDIRALVSWIGNTSNLILDPDLDSYYLMDMTLLALPQTMERLRMIAAQNRLAMDAASGTGQGRLDMMVLFALLQQSDIQRLDADVATAVAEDPRFNGVHAPLQDLPKAHAAWLQTMKRLVATQDQFSASLDEFSSLPDLLPLCADAMTATQVYWNQAREALDGLLAIRVAGFESTRLWGILLTILALAFAVAIAFMIVGDIRRSIGQTLEFARELSAGNLIHTLDSTRRDEIGSIIKSMEDFRTGFHAILSNEIQSTVLVIKKAISTLGASSQETSAGSAQQAAAVHEIVATMEDSDALARDVADRIGQVEDLTAQTRGCIHEGLDMVRANRTAMTEIKSASDQTMEGIQNLGGEIANINNIVTIINSIAGQIRIIAFNAELEANAATAGGRNFEIVATEIRRLADRSSLSAGEIQGIIARVQSAAGNLVTVSRFSLDRVHRGLELSGQLEAVFDRMLDAAESSAGSTGRIGELIREQVQAFGQILLSLRQISESVEQFVASTHNSSHQVRELGHFAGRLEQVLGRFVLREQIPREQV